MFDLPLHSIQDFLALANETDIAKNVFLWAQHMDAFTTPGFIRDGEQLYSTHANLHKEGFDCDASDGVAIHWRDVLLEEMFFVGLTIRTGVAERLVVERQEDKFLLRLEAIGRYRDWVWIDQRSTETFETTEVWRLMRAIAERFKEPHSLSTGK